MEALLPEEALYFGIRRQPKSSANPTTANLLARQYLAAWSTG
jgi:hypothetical protein